ncbi:ATP-binding cassette sub-family C member Sur isoform X2 [Manduca sexta]|nr:ATP-binding cassette sub-family C member Sur isoform X2 [Manduca sexta]
MQHYRKFSKIYEKYEIMKVNNRCSNIWKCFVRKVWPNFYIAGLLKLFGDLIGVVPPLGLAAIVQYIDNPVVNGVNDSPVTLHEFFSNGYVMLCVVTMALIGQALLSQNSTHLVTVEGTRLKTALQGMIYDKSMRLAPWSSTNIADDESSPLLHQSDEASMRTGLLTNLVAQDTYNIMSCVWVCHYIWAIPLKIAVILYLLHMKLGVSALIGTAAGVLIITPLQFYIGKKLSDNCKDISKCTDHRISKMTEIIKGMNVIKLYVWEDLFKEKILQLREVELKFLNKDSVYWSFLTFTTQISTILITVITFTVYYVLEDGNNFTAAKVFAGLAFFNQLTVPLLILPVTVLMIIQAMVSTKRIEDFLALPESSNLKDDTNKKINEAFDKRKEIDVDSTDNVIWDNPWDNNITNIDEEIDIKLDDQFTEEENLSSKSQYLVKFKSAVYTWRLRNDLLEIEDLNIPAGKLIMVVGNTGSGKSSLLSAILGEMYLEKGDVIYHRDCSTAYAGQPPWLLEGSVRDNIIMGNKWCQKKYARVLRATGLRPDLQLLPEGDATRLGSHGAPLSGGQRVRVCVARALYSEAQLLVLDEPLGALDAPLARHLVAHGLLPTTRSGRTVVLATNRLELLHYADLVIAMEGGRVSGYGRAGCPESKAVLARWAQLATEARAAAARVGAGPPDGTARERSHLVRVLSRAKFQRTISDDAAVGINEAAGAHLLAEVPMCAGGSWRRSASHQRPALSRQFSSPPPSSMYNKWRREVRRTVSADESNTTLQREASLLRRLFTARSNRTLTRWTPRTLRRLISTDSDTTTGNNIRANVPPDECTVETTYSSLTSNGVETNVGVITDDSCSDNHESENDISECTLWKEYAEACGWWSAMYWAAAAAAQALAVAADCWLTRLTADNSHNTLSEQQTWTSIQIYGAWSVGGVCAAGVAQAWCACAGARARRTLHEKLLHATLHAPLHHHHATPSGATLHRFSSDILVIDKKLPTAISRWAQLGLLCVAAILVNAIAAPWSVLALLPACLFYLLLQAVYLRNARELQSIEGQSAGRVVSLCAETYTGGSTIRAGCLQQRMRAAFMRRLDANHNALLLLNAANRWLGLSLDLVGAASVCVALGVALSGDSSAVAGLAGAYALLLPAYLAHLAKCRADLDQQLAALHRVHTDANVPQEDYREYCSIPSEWPRNGKIVFENMSVLHEPGGVECLHNINFTVNSGEKVAICGRSGSGKSTLLQSCVGATTISAGRVLVDGQDVTRVPLRALRHRLVTLPQEPAIFSGTLRENLDPLAVHTDEEIWHSLRAVGLYDFVTAQSAGLECSVARGWSAGGVARVCGARAALHARLASALVLDEPAAALDAPAERALLHALAAIAPHTTILTVAHRISSVRDYDRALVLEEGQAVEQGPVSALLEQPSSRLARMLAATRRFT